MFGSEILDVGIGLIFLFLLLGLFCSVVNELIARLAALRSSTLKTGIRNLLDGEDSKGNKLSHEFYNHPLIKGLYRTGWFDKIFKREGKPSYIPARTFAITLMDILAPPGKNGSEAFKDVSKTIGTLPDSNLKKSLLALVAGTDEKIEQVRLSMEEWFNNTMDRVAGWYKRKIQLIALGVAIVVTVGLNVDTFIIANTLYRDASVRASLITAAEEAVKQAADKDSLSLGGSITQIQEEFQRFQLPMGWSDPRNKPHGTGEWIKRIFGWLFTALAVSLGAPFWFDVLSRIVQLRSTGKEIRVGTKKEPETKPKS